jgi:cob(I)alamin adenosyltransferase
MGKRLTKIATRTGDDGTPGWDGTRTRKDAACDRDGRRGRTQLVAGVLLTEALPDEARSDLMDIQHDLFDLGGELCIPGYTMVQDAHVARLDARLAHYNAALPRLEEFILPGGSRPAALAHVSRTICRRAERAVVALGAEEAVNPAPRHYLNRLSDLLFVLARTLNRHAGGSDVLWQQRKNAAPDDA